MEKKQVKIRIDLIGTAPMDNSSVNLDNTTIDKIQTVRIYDKNKSKKILMLKEADIRQYLNLGKRKKKVDG